MELTTEGCIVVGKIRMAIQTAADYLSGAMLGTSILM
jgi:hypothetical protein